MLEIIIVLAPLVVPIINAVMQIMTLRQQKNLAVKVDKTAASVDGIKNDVSFAVENAVRSLTVNGSHGQR